MFSNGGYTKAATGTGYKKISFNGMTEQFISKIWYHLLINNWVLNVILAGILLFLIIKRGKKNFLTAEMSVVFCGFSVYSVFHKVYPQWVFDSNEMLNNGINTILAILFFANVLLCIWNVVDKNERISMCISCYIYKNIFGDWSGERLQIAADPGRNRAEPERNRASDPSLFGILLANCTTYRRMGKRFQRFLSYPAGCDFKIRIIKCPGLKTPGDFLSYFTGKYISG